MLWPICDKSYGLLPHGRDSNCRKFLIDNLIWFRQANTHTNTDWQIKTPTDKQIGIGRPTKRYSDRFKREEKNLRVWCSPISRTRWVDVQPQVFSFLAASVLIGSWRRRPDFVGDKIWIRMANEHISTDFLKYCVHLHDQQNNWGEL